MKKFIRFSFWLIFIIAVLVLGLAVYEPNDVTVSRTIVIRAPKEAVFHEMADFTGWTKWCTLFNADTAAKITFTGEPGQPGSTLEWKGDEGIIGEGVIKNLGIEGTTMKYSFTVSKPAEMLADGIFSATDTGSFTKVTWTFHKHFPFLRNAVLIVFNLEKYMGGDFEKSLANLKKHVETDVEPWVEVTEGQYAGGTIAGIRDTVQWTDIETFFGDTYSLFMKTPGAKIAGANVGLYYAYDTINKRSDVMAGIPVTDTDIPVNGITFTGIPPSPAYIAVHKGGYKSISRAHKALAAYTASKGKVQWLMIEEYKVNPGDTPDTNKYVTNIYYLVQ